MDPKLKLEIEKYKIPQSAIDARAEDVKAWMKASPNELQISAARHLCKTLEELIKYGAIITWK